MGLTTLAGSKYRKGMSSHAMDLVVHAKPSSSYTVSVTVSRISRVTVLFRIRFQCGVSLIRYGDRISGLLPYSYIVELRLSASVHCNVVAC